MIDERAQEIHLQAQYLRNIGAPAGDMLFDLLAERERLRTALQTAIVRLEILLGRMGACNEEPQKHEVSVQEAPAWVEEIRDLLEE